MVERKLFKTKLCVLYQKGHCGRQSCSFAHGDAELRRSLGSYNGRRDYQGRDLRDKLDRRLSPRRRHSPGRGDARGRNAFRGYSPSRSPEKKSERKRRKKYHLDDQSDFSESMKISDRVEHRVKERKNKSSDSKTILEEQLKEVQADADMLDHQKLQLGIYLEEKAQEAGRLTFTIQELETQLFKETEECKRITSKIKKFVKAHNRYSRIQDELKRSQVRLHKLGDQLVSDTAKTVGNEEDTSINAVIDGEITGYNPFSSKNEMLSHSSPNKKRLHINGDTSEVSISRANLINGGDGAETIRLKNLSRWNVHPAQSYKSKEAEPVNNGFRSNGSQTNEGKLKRGKHVSAGFPLDHKLKGLGSGLLFPSTSMAAHAAEEVVEIEENIEMVDFASTGIDQGTKYEVRGMPPSLPPPPPLPWSTYAQYQGEDASVDVDGLEEETVHVDIV